MIPACAVSCLTGLARLLDPACPSTPLHLSAVSLLGCGDHHTQSVYRINSKLRAADGRQKKSRPGGGLVIGERGAARLGAFYLEVQRFIFREHAVG